MVSPYRHGFLMLLILSAKMREPPRQPSSHKSIQQKQRDTKPTSTQKHHLCQPALSSQIEKINSSKCKNQSKDITWILAYPCIYLSFYRYSSWHKRMMGMADKLYLALSIQNAYDTMLLLFAL